jgi:hypothetical protein
VDRNLFTGKLARNGAARYNGRSESASFGFKVHSIVQVLTVKSCNKKERNSIKLFRSHSTTKKVKNSVSAFLRRQGTARNFQAETGLIKKFYVVVRRSDHCFRRRLR